MREDAHHANVCMHTHTICTLHRLDCFLFFLFYYSHIPTHTYIHTEITRTLYRLLLVFFFITIRERETETEREREIRCTLYRLFLVVSYYSHTHTHTHTHRFTCAWYRLFLLFFITVHTRSSRTLLCSVLCTDYKKKIGLCTKCRQSTFLPLEDDTWALGTTFCLVRYNAA